MRDLIDTLELRHLRVFVAIAECGSVTRAAASLWLSQPAATRTLADLERLLGRALVVRTNKGVSLTEAGTTLLPYAERALGTVREAVHAVGGEPDRLSVGFTWNALAEHTPKVAEVFRTRYPASQLRLERCDDDALAGLGDGRCDVAILRGIPPPDKIEHVVLYVEPRVVALPKAHRAAKGPPVGLDDLRDDTLVINSVTGLNAVAGASGTSAWGCPSYEQDILYVRNVDEWLEAIAAGSGIGTSAASTARLRPHPWITYRSGVNIRGVPVVLAWTRESKHPLTDALVAASQRVLRAARL